MTVNEILTEWSYRLDRGYPEMDNPYDILVLEQVLKDSGLDSNDVDITVQNLKENLFGSKKEQEEETSQINDKESEENEENEEKELQNYIDTISCPYDKEAAKIHSKNPKLSYTEKIKLINRMCNFKSYKPIKDLLKDKGYAELTKKGEPAELKKFSNELQNIIEDVNDKDREFFLDYLRDKNKQLNFNPQPGKRGNLFKDAEKTGISSDIITQIVRHTTQDSGKKGVGMGELALSLLFKNVGAAIGKGDLALDGKEFEIKGEGATLGARPDTVNVINLENIAKFVKYEGGEDSGLFLRKENEVVKSGKNKGKLKKVTNLYFKGAKVTQNKFSEILADIYRETDNKDEFKEAFKQDLKDIDKVEKNKQSQAVDEYFDRIQWEKGELEIQRGIALINAYRYILVEGFTRFLAHDFGSSGADTGEYIYAEGTPLEIVDQLLTAGAKFEKIAPSNLKPRIGFAKTYKEETL
mgnify:CR=1 FL=1